MHVDAHEHVVNSQTGCWWMGCLFTAGEWEVSWTGNCLGIPNLYSLPLSVMDWQIPISLAFQCSIACCPCEILLLQLNYGFFWHMNNEAVRWSIFVLRWFTWLTIVQACFSFWICFCCICMQVFIVERSLDCEGLWPCAVNLLPTYLLLVLQPIHSLHCSFLF